MPAMPKTQDLPTTNHITNSKASAPEASQTTLPAKIRATRAKHRTAVVPFALACMPVPGVTAWHVRSRSSKCCTAGQGRYGEGLRLQEAAQVPDTADLS